MLCCVTTTSSVTICPDTISEMLGRALRSIKLTGAWRKTSITAGPIFFSMMLPRRLPMPGRVVTLAKRGNIEVGRLRCIFRYSVIYQKLVLNIVNLIVQNDWKYTTLPCNRNVRQSIKNGI